MIYLLIAAGVSFILVVLFSILNRCTRYDLYDAETAALIFMIASLFLMPISSIFIQICSTTTDYQVVYEEKELKVVDESIYTLKITDRVSYTTWKKGVKEYDLYKNTDLVKSSKNLEDIKEYFEPKIVTVIGE